MGGESCTNRQRQLESRKRLKRPCGSATVDTVSSAVGPEALGAITFLELKADLESPRTS